MDVRWRPRLRMAMTCALAWTLDSHCRRGVFGVVRASAGTSFKKGGANGLETLGRAASPSSLRHDPRSGVDYGGPVGPAPCVARHRELQACHLAVDRHCGVVPVAAPCPDPGVGAVLRMA